MIVFYLFPHVSYLFVYNNWLADDRGPCRRYATLFPSHLAEIGGSTKVSYLARINLFDSLLFLSIICRPSYSKFTRCQRLCCFMAAFYLNMTISAMWFTVNPPDAVAYNIKLGFITVSYLQIYVGVVSIALTTPLIAALNAVFRNRKLKLQSGQKPLQNGCFPHWMHFCGYFLCIFGDIRRSCGHLPL